MGLERRRPHGRLPRSGVAGDDVGGVVGRQRRRVPPLQLALGVGGRVRARPDLVGRAVVDLAAERGCTPLDVMLDVSLDDDLETRFWSVLANDDAEGIAWLLPRDNVLLGLADSGPTSRSCATPVSPPTCSAPGYATVGSCPSNGPSTSSRASRPPSTAWPTGAPSQVGKAADLCVFDPDTVAPGPLRRVLDFPADGERLTADRPRG